MKKLLSTLMAAAMLFSVSPAFAETAAADEPVEVVIFHTNDVHSRVDNSAGMGYAMAAGYINAERDAGSNVLVLDAGDTFHGMPFATVEQGESIVDILNAVGYDAMAPGNHDYNYGIDRLEELSSMLDFPILACNVYDKESGELVFQPYTIKEFGDTKIGIIGVDNPIIESSIAIDKISSIEFRDGIENVTAAVDEIKDSTDAIIVVTHWGTEGVPVASDELAKIDGVDLVVDGHSHTVYENGHDVEGGSMVVSTGEYLNNLGKVVMTIDGDNVSCEATLIPKPEVYPSADITAVIDTINEDQAPYLNEVLCAIDFDLDGARENVRTGETALSNLIADAMLEASGADCGIYNGGSVRASIEAGDITRGDIIAVLPFGNQIVTINVTGAEIRAALENGVQSYPEEAGAFPQVSGMTFTFDPGAEAGSRIVDVTVGGEALDDAKEYTLATNDFMAMGSNGYTMLLKPIEVYYGGMDEAVISYINSHSAELSDATDGRIACVEESAAA